MRSIETSTNSSSFRADAAKALKLLERNLALVTDDQYAARQTLPLYAINDLRQADAQLPKSELSKFFELLDVSANDPHALQAEQMIASVVNAVGVMAGDFHKYLTRRT